ncbi:UNVERIFIED_CONTAM: hypothetical protein Scaly_0042200 [Sesamum calycinum]|uniref:Uncharacterized protein n=1 Tax=Sesamum calycinum TaxID=2727403 RepID=A0AAW2SU58_9LAMI
MVIFGPSNPKCLIDVYLERLIKELQNLWHVGVLSHDNASNQAFMIRVTLMWTANDLSAYQMVSEWSTANVMGYQFVWKTHGYFIYSMRGDTTSPTDLGDVLVAQNRRRAFPFSLLPADMGDSEKKNLDDGSQIL